MTRLPRADTALNGWHQRISMQRGQQDLQMPRIIRGSMQQLWIPDVGQPVDDQKPKAKLFLPVISITLGQARSIASRRRRSGKAAGPPAANLKSPTMRVQPPHLSVF
jgi:hypothetical protein